MRGVSVRPPFVRIVEIGDFARSELFWYLWLRRAPPVLRSSLFPFAFIQSPQLLFRGRTITSILSSSHHHYFFSFCLKKLYMIFLSFTRARMCTLEIGDLHIFSFLFRILPVVLSDCLFDRLTDCKFVYLLLHAFLSVFLSLCLLG